MNNIAPKKIEINDFLRKKDVSCEFSKLVWKDISWKVFRFEDYPSATIAELKNVLTKTGWKMNESKKPQDSYFFPKPHEVKTVIMFSGGIDSLSLALRHLEKKEPVMLLSLIYNPEECIAAKITVDMLQSIYGDSMVGIQYILSPLYFSGKENSYGLVQQPVAAFFSSFMPVELAKHAKYLELAYCMNDDAISYLAELRTLYNTSFSFKMGLPSFPKIKFPLTKTKHYENLSYINTIESKRNVLFPTFSSEKVVTKYYTNGKNELYMIRCDAPTEMKENKKCPYKGYIVEIVRDSPYITAD